MAKKNTIKIRMQSEASPYYYTATKNPKNNPGKKFEFMGYDPNVRKHVLFKEAQLAKAS